VPEVRSQITATADYADFSASSLASAAPEGKFEVIIPRIREIRGFKVVVSYGGYW
jgi:hypothetical protein